MPIRRSRKSRKKKRTSPHCCLTQVRNDVDSFFPRRRWLTLLLPLPPLLPLLLLLLLLHQQLSTVTAKDDNDNDHDKDSSVPFPVVVGEYGVFATASGQRRSPLMIKV